MANVKISALPAATSVASADVLPIVQSATTKKATIQNVSDALGVTTTVAGSSPGLVYIGSASFSNAAAGSIDNCFSSAYRNYKIVLSLNATNGNSDVFYFRFRSASSDVTTSQYQYSGYESQFTTYSSNYGAQNNNAARVGYVYATGDYFGLTMDLISPNLAEQTAWTWQSSSWDGGSVKVLQTSGAGIFNTNNQFTGISFGTFSGASATTGRFEVYGYRI